MADSDKYDYGRTLRFFEAYYPYDNEDVHYADVLLSMGNASSIDELISIRERIKKKIDNLDSSKYNEIPKNIIDDISKSISYFSSYSEPLRSRVNSNLRQDVNSCYDENLFRLFKECSTITAESC